MPTRPDRLDKGGYQDTYRPQSMEHLDVGHDQVIIVRGEGWTQETFDALRASLRPDILLINLPEGDTLEVLSEDEMYAAGWVRADDPVISRAVESETPSS